MHGQAQQILQHTAEHVHVQHVDMLQQKVTLQQAHGAGVEMQQQVKHTQEQEHVGCVQKLTQKLTHLTWHIQQ